MQGQPWRWIDRVNDAWGDYVSACPFEGGYERAIVKILFDDGYVVTVRCRDLDDESEIRITLLDVVLPAVGATSIEPTDSYD
ncbi:MAG: hypothetical protein QM831_17640 [Kofleriaceae bacterium]